MNIDILVYITFPYLHGLDMIIETYTQNNNNHSQNRTHVIELIIMDRHYRQYDTLNQYIIEQKKTLAKDPK